MYCFFVSESLTKHPETSLPGKQEVILYQLFLNVEVNKYTTLHASWFEKLEGGV